MKALAAKWKHEIFRTREWERLGHIDQYLLALDATSFFDLLLFAGPRLRQYQYKIGVCGATSPHSSYWYVDPAIDFVNVTKAWPKTRSPYSVLPKFGSESRGLLITHLLIYLCYSRLKKELTMANIIPIQESHVARDVRASKLGVNHALNVTEAMFRHRNTLNDSAYDKAMDLIKTILKKSATESATR